GIEVRVDNQKNENVVVNKNAEDEPNNDSNKNSGIIPLKTCDKRDGLDDIKTVGINNKSNRCNIFVYCWTVAGTGDANMINVVTKMKSGVSPFKNKKTKLEGNLVPTEGGYPSTKGLKKDQSQGSIVQGMNIGNKSNSSNGIILVNKIKGERDKEKRIAVSNDRRYQTSNEKIDDLSI
ncbi:12236_t:CDS:2, partial [Gigaspora margarita]